MLGAALSRHLFVSSAKFALTYAISVYLRLPHKSSHLLRNTYSCNTESIQQGTLQPGIESAQNRTARPCKDWCILSAEHTMGAALPCIKDGYTRSGRRYQLHKASTESSGGASTLKPQRYRMMTLSYSYSHLFITTTAKYLRN